MRQVVYWLRRLHVPRAAWACALVALANGLAWSLITPPFQVPDENAHYAYVQQVAERGTLPRPSPAGALLSPREDAMLGALFMYGIIGRSNDPSLLSEAQQQVVDATSRRPLSPRGSGDALTATNNPPLYYLYEAIPYGLAVSGNVLDRLTAMRLGSTLLGAATVLLIYLFLRELLPACRWAWSTGALVAALQPLFGFMSGGVNNDNLLYAAAAGVLWAIARAFRRGLSPGTGVLIGAFLCLGLLGKLTMLAFVPAVALALVLLVRREWSGRRREALGGAAWALGIVAAPVLIFVLLEHLVWHRTVIPATLGSVQGHTTRAFSYREELSHIWQLFLPSLWMRHQFTYWPLWETWFKGFFGTFGWLDFAFPEWVFKFARDVSLAVCALAVAELVRRRRALASRLSELAVYVLALLALAVEIGVASYHELVTSGGRFEQARYLLPLLGLYAAVAGLATRFGGRRWGPAFGALLVVLAIGHDLFAQGLAIARYYT